MSVRRAVFYSFLILILLLPVVALADDGVSLQAYPSSTEISLEDNISIEFKVSVDKYETEIGNPEYDAPDFDEVNTFAGMSGVETTYVNGQLSVKRTKSVTVVLHPQKAGELKIRNIRVKVDGKKVTAPPITVTVVSDGSKLARRGRSRAYGKKSQLPRSGVQPSQTQGPSKFFLKTEPDKLKVYKGEQIILTYALYARGVRFAGPPQVERYPTTSGFLKEQLDVPILRGLPRFSPAVVGGKEYRRAVLAQYAIFPVKTGTLKIDPLKGKFTYRSTRQRSSRQTDDPFNMFNNFFQTMQTSQSTRSSDWIKIEVLPLPAAGQPEDFSGLVGDFNITAAVDKYQVKVGESIHVKVKIDGRGHAGSMEGLNIQWPDDFELYEDKSHTSFYKSGNSERFFDFMLIPKAKGTYTIPEIELSMFDPDAKAYRVRKTKPLKVAVAEGSLGSVYVAKKGAKAKGTAQDIRYWMTDDVSASSPIAKYIGGGVAAASMAFALFTLASLFSSESRIKIDPAKEAKRFRERAQQLGKSNSDPAKILAQVEACLGDILDSRYRVKIGSMTRSHINMKLSEKNIDSDIIKDVERLLEHCENIRFMPGGGDQKSALSAVNELASLIDKIYS